MSNVVLDASAILAFLQQEPGADKVLDIIEDDNVRVAISAVNFCEVVTKLVRDGGSSASIVVAIEPFRSYVVDFTLPQAEYSGELYRRTKALGLSLGDRACFALAAISGATIVTADRAWKKLNVGVPVDLVRRSS